MRITMMQEMEQRVNVQLVEQHPHYYQGATISESRMLDCCLLLLLVALR